jgi:endonuclease YncB( thermonuclease family)
VSAQSLRGTARVVDGDSIVVGDKQVRLNGLDAVELDQPCLRKDGSSWPCGEAARDALVSLVDGHTVICQRAVLGSVYVGDCRMGDLKINRWVLLNGWAAIDRRGSRRYVGFETKARKAELNIWSGEFERPWIWRGQMQRRGASGVSYLFFDMASIDP